MTVYNPNLDIVNDNVYTNLVQFCPYVLKIWSKNQILTPIKGRIYVAKITLYNPNVDLVNDNVHT